MAIFPGLLLMRDKKLIYITIWFTACYSFSLSLFLNAFKFVGFFFLNFSKKKTLFLQDSLLNLL